MSQRLVHWNDGSLTPTTLIWKESHKAKIQINEIPQKSFTPHLLFHNTIFIIHKEKPAFFKTGKNAPTSVREISPGLVVTFADGTNDTMVLKRVSANGLEKSQNLGLAREAGKHRHECRDVSKLGWVVFSKGTFGILLPNFWGIQTMQIYGFFLREFP